LPSWDVISKELKNELKKDPDAINRKRRECINKLSLMVDRNVIVYYSGWLQHPDCPVAISDTDMNGFMNVICNLDKSKGLDLILHTPGGSVAATESIANYLRNVFGDDIRAFVPHLAMSGGTILSCACKEIIMGSHSSIGPVDPQFGPRSAYAVVEEFNEALEDVKENPNTALVWREIISQYHPTLVSECQKAIEWSGEITKKLLKTGMFKDCEDKDELSEKAVNDLNNHTDTKNHGRHIDINMARESGLKVTRLEDDKELQDCVLTLHHVYMFTFSNTRIAGLIESNNGNSFSMVRPEDPRTNEAIKKSTTKFLKTVIEAMIIIGIVVFICGLFGCYSDGSFGEPNSLIAIGFAIIAVSALVRYKYR
jgi:Periplasmic serine proteases (ClpP class)